MRRLVLVGQEHRAGLRAQLDDVARAVVFLVLPRLLVLLHDVAVVLVDRVAGREAGLLVRAHAQAVEVHRGLGFLDHRWRVSAAKFARRRPVDGVGVRIGVRRQVDLGARHVQEAQRALPAASARASSVETTS